MWRVAALDGRLDSHVSSFVDLLRNKGEETQVTSSAAVCTTELKWPALCALAAYFTAAWSFNAVAARHASRGGRPFTLNSLDAAQAAKSSNSLAFAAVVEVCRRELGCAASRVRG